MPCVTAARGPGAVLPSHACGLFWSGRCSCFLPCTTGCVAMREGDWPSSADCGWALGQPFAFVPCPRDLILWSSGRMLTVPSSVPGPCEPEDLIDGIIFAANYLGSTQLLSERNPSKNIRMMQAQEAVSRVKVLVGSAGRRFGQVSNTNGVWREGGGSPRRCPLWAG